MDYKELNLQEYNRDKLRIVLKCGAILEISTHAFERGEDEIVLITTNSKHFADVMINVNENGIDKSCVSYPQVEFDKEN